MEQLILDIPSESDAALIKELLKKFKDVSVHSFFPDLTDEEVKRRIEEGIKDADEGRTTPLKDVKDQIAQKIRDYRKQA